MEADMVMSGLSCSKLENLGRWRCGASHTFAFGGQGLIWLPWNSALPVICSYTVKPCPTQRGEDWRMRPFSISVRSPAGFPISLAILGKRKNWVDSDIFANLI